MHAAAPIEVVVVEDDAVLRGFLRTVIAGTPGFRCLGDYGNPQVFLKAVGSLRPGLVIMDLELPRLSGLECLEALRAKRLSLQVMVLSIHDEDEWLYPALRMGAAGYLIKPVDPATLIESLRELHEGGSPMSPSIARRVLKEFRQELGRREVVEALSERELETLRALAQGMTYQEIADSLAIKRSTIARHLHNIYQKLHVRTAAGAVGRLLGA